MATRSEVIKELDTLTTKQLQTLTGLCLPPVAFIPFPTEADKEAIRKETEARRRQIFQSDRALLINLIAPAVLHDADHAIENIHLSLQKAENAAKKRHAWQEASRKKYQGKRKEVRDYLREHPEVEAKYRERTT